MTFRLKPKGLLLAAVAVWACHPAWAGSFARKHLEPSPAFREGVECFDDEASTQDPIALWKNPEQQRTGTIMGVAATFEKPNKTTDLKDGKGQTTGTTYEGNLDLPWYAGDGTYAYTINRDGSQSLTITHDSDVTTISVASDGKVTALGSSGDDRFSGTGCLCVDKDGKVTGAVEMTKIGSSPAETKKVDFGINPPTG